MPLCFILLFCPSNLFNVTLYYNNILHYLIFSIYIFLFHHIFYFFQYIKGYTFVDFISRGLQINFTVKLIFSIFQHYFTPSNSNLSLKACAELKVDERLISDVATQNRYINTCGGSHMKRLRVLKRMQISIKICKCIWARPG